MANVTVLVWQITATYNAPYAAAGYVAGNYIHCILDDSTLAITTQIRDTSQIGGGTLVNTPVTGPSIFFGDGGSATTSFIGTPTPTPLWSRCDGTTYQKVVVINSWPFAEVGSFPNSSQCTITPVCDLTISDVYTVTPASGPSVADGSVTISATSSNGVIRYSLTEGFDYSSGQSSSTFSSLLPGNYTIYAKDPIGCTDEILVNIPVTTSYGLKYYFEYYCVKGALSRIEIEERAYEGASSEMDKMAASPFIIRYSGEDDKYHTVWAGNADLNLRTSTNLQWQEFFTNDSTKYKVKHYRYESGWALKYVGFIYPSLYFEPYLNPPFDTTIAVTDGIGTLQNEDFLDDNGNELYAANSELFIIAMILRKTGLNLSIRSCIDLLEVDMDDTDNDDVLPQTYVDCRIFYSDKGKPDKCHEVLDKILKPYGAYIKSALGYYWIIRQESSIGDIAYRQFDYQGNFESSGTFESLVGIYNPDNVTPEGFFFRDAAQQLQFQQNYGTFRVSHDLLPDNNLIDSGAFELEHITETGGQQGFVDWNVFVGQAGLRYGYEAVKNGDSKGALFFDLSNANAPQTDNVLYSKKLRVNSSVFDFSFQYHIEPVYSNFPFVRLAYQVKATRVSDSYTVYYSPYGVWDTTVLKNEIYINSYNQFGKFERRLPPLLLPDEPWDIEISLYCHNHYGLDVSDDDFSELKAIPTTGQFTVGKRIYYYDEAASVIRAYELRGSNEAESLPDTVRPTDYNGSDARVWHLLQSISSSPNQSFVRTILVDNVTFNQLVLILLPNSYYSDAPNPAIYEMIPNQFNKSVFTQEVILGDAPGSGDLGVISATIPNPQVYRSWLRLSDGTPTAGWKRRDIDEEAPLLEILLNDYAAQRTLPTQKLYGTLIGAGFLSPIHSIEDFDNDSKKYVITSYEFDDRNNAYRVALEEVITGADGLPPPDIAGFSIGFSIGFNA